MIIFALILQICYEQTKPQTIIFDFISISLKRTLHGFHYLQYDHSDGFGTDIKLLIIDSIIPKYLGMGSDSNHNLQ